MKLIELIKFDLYRYKGNCSFKNFIKSVINVPSFNYIFWLRVTSKYNNFFLRFLLKRKMIKYGIEIHPETKIGEGFYIGHWGGIVISNETCIGTNCNISQGVTIGISGENEERGSPIIGNNVYIGPGAKIFGKIYISNGIAIGANAVVTKNIEENAVVVGIPAKTISYNGSIKQINNIYKGNIHAK